MSTAVIETLHYVKQFSGQSIVVKLGGAILEDPGLLATLCQDLSLLKAAGLHVVIVHGGSTQINAALATYKVNSEFINGLRMTSPEAMTIIEMVLSGQVNKSLVRQLSTHGVNAVGISGVDNQLLLCKTLQAELGLVGEITEVNVMLIKELLAQDIIPVIAPIGVNAQGDALNINADWAACEIALALETQKLVYLTDQSGILDAQSNLISQCDSGQLLDLINQNIVNGGMLTKVNTILKALTAGLDYIHIISGKQPHSLLTDLFTQQGLGTLCCRRAA